MRLDTETLRPVLIGMSIYLALAKISPNVKSTGFRPVDDVIAMMIANKGAHMSGVLLVGIIVLVSNKLANDF